MPAVLYVRRSIPGAVFLQVTASWPGVAMYCATCGRDVVPLQTYPGIPSVNEIRNELRAHRGIWGRAGERAARLLVARGVARESFGSYGGTA